MDNDATLRSCLVALAAVMAAVGLCSFSLKKVLATYAYGILGIAGILLPDWEFFDRDFSQWFTPMTVPPGPPGNRIARSGRFKFYPMRVAMLAAIYSFGVYKWWMFKFYPMRVAMLAAIYSFGVYKWWMFVSS